MPRRFDPILVAGWADALGPTLAEALPGWIAEHSAGPAPDPDRFLVELHASGRIDRAAFRRALLVRGVPWLTLEPDAAEALPGASTHGHFALLGEIGRGGQGAVHVARDLVLGRKVAFKIESGVTGDGAEQRRFVREAQITAQIEHPNIVPVHELRRLASGQRAYVMKVIEGRTLAEIVLDAWVRHQSPARVNEPRELAERIEYFLRVCDAVGYAHARGVIHRDLKPDNVMIGPHREVYVMDWGVARLIDGDDEVPIPLPSGLSPAGTQVGDAVGTPMYMSPEQARGETGIGAASDQYALGLMLQELVTLQPAVRAPSIDLALFHAGQGWRGPMVHLRDGLRVAPELVAIVAKATAADPEDRYPSVDALAEDVRGFLRGDEVRAMPDTLAGRASRVLFRHREAVIRSLLVGALVGGALVSASGLAALWQVNRAQEHEIVSTAALTAAERRADAVEGQLGRYGQLAEAISAAATILLAHGSPVDAASVAPPPLRHAPVYGAAVTFAAPSFWLPPGEPPPTVARLGLLRDDLRRALIRSGTDGDVVIDDDAAWQLLAVQGVPVRRIHVALDDGTHLVYPGTGPQGVGRDARREDWYAAAAGRRFLHWRVPGGAPGVALATVSRSIFGSGDADFEGVVALEVRLPSELLVTPVYPAGWLIGADGSVLLSTGGAPLDGGVLAAISASAAWVGTDGAGATCASAPLVHLGWVYVGCER